MSKRVRKEAPPAQSKETDTTEASSSDETSAEQREVLLEDIDKLLDEIDEVLDTETQRELDEARERAAYRDKLKSIAFLGKRAVDPCAQPGLIRVPEYIAERLLSAGLAREHDCNDCD